MPIASLPDPKTPSNSGASLSLRTAHFPLPSPSTATVSHPSQGQRIASNGTIPIVTEQLFQATTSYDVLAVTVYSEQVTEENATQTVRMKTDTYLVCVGFLIF